METLRTLDQSKRGKPPEVENLIKMPSMVSNPITEKDSELLSNFGLLIPNSYQDLLNDRVQKVQFLRQWDWQMKWKSLEKRRLHKILKKNSTLLFKFMIKNSSSAPPYFGKLMFRVFGKLVRRKRLSLTVIKKLSGCKVASSMTEGSAEHASSVLTGRLAPTANDTMIHQFIDLTIE